MKNREHYTLKELHEAYEDDKNVLSAFWKWQVHLGILIVYGGISWVFMSKPGMYYLGETLAIVTAVVNGIWVVFRGVPMFCKWFLKLVEI